MVKSAIIDIDLYLVTYIVINFLYIIDQITYKQKSGPNTRFEQAAGLYPLKIFFKVNKVNKVNKEYGFP